MQLHAIVSYFISGNDLPAASINQNTIIKAPPNTTKINYNPCLRPRSNSCYKISVQLTYTNVPELIESRTIPNKAFALLTRTPIVIPTGVERLNETIKHTAFLNVNPALEKVPPREIDATKLWSAILNVRYAVN